MATAMIVLLSILCVSVNHEPEEIRTLSDYLRSLVKGVPIESVDINGSEPKSKGGTRVIPQNCKQNNKSTQCIVKIPNDGTNEELLRMNVCKGVLGLKKIGHCIRVSPFALNILTMNAFQKIPKIRDHVERYTNIFRLDTGTYAIEEEKADCNLHEYIKYSLEPDQKKFPNITKQGQSDLWEKVCTILVGVFETLDYLFKHIQFHHCDPKAQQILIYITDDDDDKNDTPNSLLGDFDKTTFTMKIDDHFHRLTVNNNPYKIKPWVSYFKRAYAVENYQEWVSTFMRTETFPRTSNAIEKSAFLASCVGAMVKNSSIAEKKDLFSKLNDFKIGKDSYGYLNGFENDLDDYKPGHKWALKFALQYCKKLKKDKNKCIFNKNLTSKLELKDSKIRFNSSPD